MEHAQLALCCLNASLFYWFVTVFSDCRHLNKREVDALPIDLEALSNSASKRLLLQLGGALMADLQKNSQNSEMHYGHDTLTIHFTNRSSAFRRFFELIESVGNRTTHSGSHRMRSSGLSSEKSRRKKALRALLKRRPPPSSSRAIALQPESLSPSSIGRSQKSAPSRSR